jgi:hypothetical protein
VPKLTADRAIMGTGKRARGARCDHKPMTLACSAAPFVANPLVIPVGPGPVKAMLGVLIFLFVFSRQVLRAPSKASEVEPPRGIEPRTCSLRA